jgi:hypothetical protein
MTRRRRPVAAPVGRHLAGVRHAASSVPLVKKVLLTLMVIGTMGTTVGAGTFAAFTATARNPAAPFAAGTLVLSDQVGTGTTCLSTGTSGTTDANVDTSACDLVFDSEHDPGASSKRPGEGDSVAMHIRNAGSLPGTLAVSSAADCATVDPSDQPAWHGTADDCDTVQLAIADGTTCYWGDNMGNATTRPFITGAPLTYPLTITSTDNRFKLTVDGVAHDDLTLDVGTYGTATLFAAQVDAKISAWATAGPTAGGAIRITSKTAVTGASNVVLNIPSTTPSSTGLKTMGFMDGSAAAGPGVCATATGDRDHTLADFRASTTATPLALGPLASLATRDLTVSLSVPAVITDQMQGRQTDFEMTWTLLQ